MLRAAFLAVLLCGCDRVWELRRLDDPPDARGALQGCADNTREGFPDVATYPDIAACAGAWSSPGLRDVVAQCDHGAGNDSDHLDGVGCSAADVCAIGWHVCQTKVDVAQSLPMNLRSCAGLQASLSTFFATAEGGPGGKCDDVNDNDDFQGCGTYGTVVSTCAPLDRTSTNMCVDIRKLGGWDCPENQDEVHTVTKSDATAGGGVLCCRDR